MSDNVKILIEHWNCAECGKTCTRADMDAQLKFCKKCHNEIVRSHMDSFIKRRWERIAGGQATV